MGQSTQPKRERPSTTSDTRDALTTAGLQAFAEHGYTRSRLADIARGADLTTGAFYRHFSGKQDFYDALFADYGNALQARLNRCASLGEQLETWITVAREHRGVVRAAAEVALPGTDAATARRQLRDACASLLARYLQDMPSWRQTHGAAVMLVDTLDQHALMEAAGWIPERDPAAVAAALDRLAQRGLYR